MSLVAAGALLAAGCGSPAHTGHGAGTPNGSASAAPTVIEVSMTELAFAPARIEVPRGVPVQLRVTNDATVAHELLIGDEEAQRAAEEEMRAGDMAGMHDHGHGHDVPYVYLEPGETGVVEHTFDDAGELLIGCHVAGHWAAGMRGTLEVT